MNEFNLFNIIKLKVKDFLKMMKIVKVDGVSQVKMEKSLIQRCSMDISKPIFIFRKEKDGKPLILMSSIKSNNEKKRR